MTAEMTEQAANVIQGWVKAYGTEEKAAQALNRRTHLGIKNTRELIQKSLDYLAMREIAREYFANPEFARTLRDHTFAATYR